jgi:spermidine/putrescine transport system substrate-binding protein
MSEEFEGLSASRRYTRRNALIRGAQVTAGAGALAAFLAACGGSDSTTSATSEAAATTEAEAAATTAAPALSGEVVMMNYPGWMGETTVADFKAATGVDVKEVEGLTEGTSAAAAQVAQNKDEYDMSLGGPVLAQMLETGGLLAQVNPANIPNLANVADHFKQAYPWGPPTDYGKTGFAYRKDLMSEQPTSWADFWALAPKYSGKLTVFDYDVDILGAALIKDGYSVNATEESEINAARDSLIELKPHLLAILPTDASKPLLKGTAVMGMDYDYSVAYAQRENENIVWVSPEEGMPAYLDGWLAINGTDKLAEIEAFMNFLLEPENYAKFINTIGSSFVMPDAIPLIDKAITENPALAYDEAAVKTIEFQQFLGEDVTKRRARAWQEFKNA